MAIDFNSITSPKAKTGATKINFGSIIPVKKPVVTSQPTQKAGNSPNIFFTPQENYANVPKYKMTKEEIFGQPSTKISQSTPPSGTAKDAANPKKNTEVITGPVKQSYNNFVDKIDKMVTTVSDTKNRNVPVSEIIGKELEVLTGAAGLVFSPISTAFSVAESLPGVLGVPGKIVNKAFEVAGTIGGHYTSKAIDILPIPEEDKKNLRPAAAEVGSLFGQVLLGKVAHTATKKAMPNKTVESIQEEYSKNLKSEILKEDSVITPERAREISTEAARKTVETLKSVPEKIGESEKNFKLVENVEPVKEGYIRVYQTGIKKNGLIERDSYVDTKTSEHVSRGTANEEKVYQDILKSEFDKFFRKIDDAKTGVGIYKAKEDIQGIVYSEAGQTNPTFVPKIADDFSSSFKKKGLLPEDFDAMPRQEKFTFAESAKNAFELVNKDITRTERIIAGKEPLPSNIQPGFFLDAVNEHIIKTNNAELAVKLASSPILKETSVHAQALVSYRALSKESLPNIVAEIKKAREENVAKKKEGIKKEAKKGLKEEVRRTAPKIKDWVEYIDSLKCK